MAPARASRRTNWTSSLTDAFDESAWEDPLRDSPAQVAYRSDLEPGLRARLTAQASPAAEPAKGCSIRCKGAIGTKPIEPVRRFEVQPNAKPAVGVVADP